MPDFSGDEAPDDPNDTLDETLCLFDGQLVDDELYALWAGFPADSRVLVVTDCCHSGTNIKARDDRRHGGGADDARPRPRAMPLAVAARVARNQAAFYKEISAEGDRGLGRPGDARDVAADRRQRAAALGLPGQPGGDGRAHERPLHQPAARDLGRRRLPGRLRRLPPGDRRPDAAPTRPRTSSRSASPAPPTTPSGRSTSEGGPRKSGAGPVSGRGVASGAGEPFGGAGPGVASEMPRRARASSPRRARRRHPAENAVVRPAAKPFFLSSLQPIGQCRGGRGGPARAPLGPPREPVRSSGSEGDPPGLRPRGPRMRATAPKAPRAPSHPRGSPPTGQQHPVTATTPGLAK